MQLIAYATSYPNDMVLETNAVIYIPAEVPPSSLIRYGKSFGFCDLSEMQKVFPKDWSTAWATTGNPSGDSTNKSTNMELRLNRNWISLLMGDWGMHNLLNSLTDEKVEKAALILANVDLVNVGVTECFDFTLE